MAQRKINNNAQRYLEQLETINGENQPLEAIRRSPIGPAPAGPFFYRPLKVPPRITHAPRCDMLSCMRRNNVRFLLLFVSLLSANALVVQQTTTAPASSENGSALLLKTSEHETRIAETDFKAMGHVSVIFHNTHINADETYTGVRVADLLAKMGAPLGNDLRGKALADYIVATGMDGYRAVLALAEVDPSFHPGEVIVADTMNGKPLDEHNGPFKLVVTEDNRPARSVRNLVSIELKSAQ
jgi:hypothetical protein